MSILYNIIIPYIRTDIELIRSTLFYFPTFQQTDHYDMEIESRAKRTLYIGGLDEGVTEAILHAAFLPFGDIKDINLPLNHQTGKHRGFCFLEYEEENDAQEAIDNMEGAELFGKTLRVTNAKVQQMQKGKAVWSAEEWYANLQSNEQGDNPNEVYTEETTLPAVKQNK